MILKIDKELKFANDFVRRIRRPANLDLDIGIVKDLTKNEFLQFQKAFQRLVSEMRSKNINLNHDSLLTQAIRHNVVLLGPRTIAVKIIGICNYECKFCGAHSPVARLRTKERLKRLLAFKTFKKIVNDAYDLGSENIQISGSGEPLLHPQILPMISYIAKKGLGVIIFTNASVPRVAARILKLPTAYKLSFVVNLSAISPDKYALIHGGDPAFFNETLNTIRLLNKRFSLILSFVIDRDTAEDIFPFIYMIHRLGIRNLWLKLLIENNMDYQSLSFSKIQQNALLDKLIRIRKLCRSLGINVDMNSLYGFFLQKNKKIKIRRCFMGWQNIFVDLDGYVSYCCKKDDPIGRVVSGNFKKVFYSAAYRNAILRAKIPHNIDSRDWKNCGLCVSAVKNKKIEGEAVC